MSQYPGLPPSAGSGPRPRPGGIPPAILLYALCLVPITAFAGWVVTYGQDEEALERKLRDKYGNEIAAVESKKQQMSDLYMAAIKNPGSNQFQEERLQQVLRGGRGEVKRHHAIDPKYYGTEEGLQAQNMTKEEMAAHQEEERERLKRLKKKMKRLRKKQQQQQSVDGEEGGGSSDDSESEGERDNTSYSNQNKREAAAAVAGLALASAAVSKANAEEGKSDAAEDNNPFKKIKAAREEKLRKRKDKKKKQSKTDEASNISSGIDLTQVATMTAVAGTAALIGFLVGGGRRQ